MQESRTFTAFAGKRLISSGAVQEVLARTKEHLDADTGEVVLIFEDQTGQQVDFDFRGTVAEVLARLEQHPLFARTEERTPSQKSGPGRPSLGVVSREVSLLPRHWEWLGSQPGGASATLRRLVDGERKRSAGGMEARRAWDAAGKFMWAMCGDLPDFEEASRALYAKEMVRLEELVRAWPGDVRTHVLRLAGEAARLQAAADNIVG